MVERQAPHNPDAKSGSCEHLRSPKRDFCSRLFRVFLRLFASFMRLLRVFTRFYASFMRLYAFLRVFHTSERVLMPFYTSFMRLYASLCIFNASFPIIATSFGGKLWEGGSENRK